MKGVEGGQPWGIPECLVKITDLWWLELVVGSVLNKSLWLMITTVFLLLCKASSYPDLAQRFVLLLLKLGSRFPMLKSPSRWKWAGDNFAALQLEMMVIINTNLWGFNAETFFIFRQSQEWKGSSNYFFKTELTTLVSCHARVGTFTVTFSADNPLKAVNCVLRCACMKMAFTTSEWTKMKSSFRNEYRRG